MVEAAGGPVAGGDAGEAGEDAGSEPGGWWRGTLVELVEMPLVTYDEIVANSKLTDIIHSIELDYRLHFAHHLWSHRQKYWWLTQIIIPIARLPQELLHQILFIIIDEANASPLVSDEGIPMFAYSHQDQG